MLTFVLPLALSGTGRDDNDLARCGLLLASLARFFDRSKLEQLMVVTRGEDMAAVSEALAPWAEALKIAVMDEAEICPELALDPDTANDWPSANTGWFRQQLIKLAAHAHVATPYYMTLDADILLARPFGMESLFDGGKPLLGMLTADDFARLFRPEIAAHETEVRRIRTAQAERALKLERPQRYCARWYGETPVILDAARVGELAGHLCQAWGKPWRRALLDILPWTEYSLYFVFLEERGLIESSYAPSGGDAVLRLSHSLWRPAGDYLVPRPLAAWNVADAFAPEGPGVAVAVQSYLGYAVEAVAERAAPYLLGQA